MRCRKIFWTTTAEVDDRNVLTIQREQFLALANPVLIQVAPQPETGEFGIAAIDFAIAIAVQVT